MAALVQRIGTFRSCDSPLSNFHFDALIATAAAVSTYFQKRGEFFAGLQVLAVSVLAERAILWICTGDYQIPINSDEKILAAICSGLITAGLEEFLYTYILLNTQKSIFFSVLRIVSAMILGDGASRSIRHSDHKKHNICDSVVGLGWAVGREIVIRKVDSQNALLFSAITNGLIFGLHEQMKFSASMRSYKFITSVAFRWILSYYAIVSKPNVVRPLVAHALFNVSRNLPA